MDTAVNIRSFEQDDLSEILQLCKKEGWHTLADHSKDTLTALMQSQSYVLVDSNHVIGYIRALSDGAITTFVCEVLVHHDYRGRRLGKALLDHCHQNNPKTRIDLLATTASKSFYESHQFKPFWGFRKSY